MATTGTAVALMLHQIMEWAFVRYGFGIGLVGTPDLDMYKENYRTSSPGVGIVQMAGRLWALADFAACGAGAPVPRDVLVPFPAIAAVLAAAPGAAVAPKGRSQTDSQVPVVVLATGVAPHGWGWRSVEDLTGLQAWGGAFGAGAPSGPSLAGVAARRQVAMLATGHSVFVALVADSEVSQLRREFRGSDVCILSVVRSAVGRERPWSFVVADRAEEQIYDFGVKPPRSAKWRATCQQRDGGPVLHSEVWKSSRRLQDSDFGVGELETSSRIVETLGTVDQVDFYNLAGVEANAKLPLDEVQALLGGGRAPSIVRSGLLDQVAKELERSTDIKKTARKLREKQAAQARNGGKSHPSPFGKGMPTSLTDPFDGNDPWAAGRGKRWGDEHEHQPAAKTSEITESEGDDMSGTATPTGLGPPGLMLDTYGALVEADLQTDSSDSPHVSQPGAGAAPRCLHFMFVVIYHGRWTSFQAASARRWQFESGCSRWASQGHSRNLAGSVHMGTGRSRAEESQRQLRVLTEAGQQSQLASDRLRAQVEALQASRGAAEHAEEVRQQAVDVLEGQVHLLQRENGRLLSEVESLRGREATQDESGRRAWQLERQSLQEEIDRLKRQRVDDDIARRQVQEEWNGLREKLRRDEDERAQVRSSFELRASFDPSLRELQDLEAVLMEQEEDALGVQAALSQPRRRGPETAARARLAEETRRLRHRIGEFAARQYSPGLSSLGDVPGDWAGGLELGGFADLVDLPGLAELPTAPSAAGSRQQQGSAPAHAPSLSSWRSPAGVQPQRAQPAPLLVGPPATPSASPPAHVMSMPAQRPGVLADDSAKGAGAQHDACVRGASKAVGSAERPLRFDGVLAENSDESSRGRGLLCVRGGDAAPAQPAPLPKEPPAAPSARPSAQAPPARPDDEVLEDDSAERAEGQPGACVRGGAAQAAGAADRPLRPDGAIVEVFEGRSRERDLFGALDGYIDPAAGEVDRPFEGMLAEDCGKNAREQQPAASPADSRAGCPTPATGAAERPLTCTLTEVSVESVGEQQPGASLAGARCGAATLAVGAAERPFDGTLEEHPPGASPASTRSGAAAAAGAAGPARHQIADLFAEDAVECSQEHQPGASSASARDDGSAAAASAAGRQVDDLLVEGSVESVGERQLGASPGSSRDDGVALAAGRQIEDVFADQPSEHADPQPAADFVGASASPLASAKGAASSCGPAASPRPPAGGAGPAFGTSGGGVAELARQRPLQDMFGDDSDGDDAAAAALATASAALSQAPGRQPTPKGDVAAGFLGEIHKHQDSPSPRAKRAAALAGEGTSTPLGPRPVSDMFADDSSSHHSAAAPGLQEVGPGSGHAADSAGQRPGSPRSAGSRPNARDSHEESSSGSLPSLPMGAAPARGDPGSSGSVRIGANASSAGSGTSGASGSRHASPLRSAGASSGSKGRGGTESSPALSIPDLGVESCQGERRPSSGESLGNQRAACVDAVSPRGSSRGSPAPASGSGAGSGQVASPPRSGSGSRSSGPPAAPAGGSAGWARSPPSAGDARSPRSPGAASAASGSRTAAATGPGASARSATSGVSGGLGEQLQRKVEQKRAEAAARAAAAAQQAPAAQEDAEDDDFELSGHESFPESSRGSW
ncbi:unnamed protein product [Prorocentrum cordatum]|uniref:Uncharacterized protein n=1 Tax=Prorocentrum cordatum TaxID=2364126 RepID=A0ABN9TKM5_9DINO|nr:unnamed protein product [Polarella glacialis]